MKIRSDYVSNSSSSSFIIIGEKMDVKKFDIEAFDSIGEDEVYLLVLPNRGSEGDYIFALTPEMLMDFDMHQLDLSNGNLPLVKAKYYITEGGYLHKASKFKKTSTSDWYDDDDDGDDERLDKKCRSDGMEFPSGCKMFRFSKDYGNPRERSEILEEIETALKYG